MPMPPDKYSMPSRDFSTLLGATRVAPVDADCAWSVALQVAARNAALIQPIWRASFMRGLLGLSARPIGQRARRASSTGPIGGGFRRRLRPPIARQLRLPQEFAQQRPAVEQPRIAGI